VAQFSALKFPRRALGNDFAMPDGMGAMRGGHGLRRVIDATWVEAQSGIFP